ncbi:MAG: hypothetical protein ACK4P3_05265 [Fimbriimonadaceae bacterium]
MAATIHQRPTRHPKQRPSTEAPRPAARPAPKKAAIPRYRPDASAKRRARTRFLGTVFAMAITFGAITYLIYLSSSLVGQVMLEQARRQSLSAEVRARQATMQQAGLQDRLESLTSVASIDRWATVQGMSSPIEIAIGHERNQPIVASASPSPAQ